MSIDVKAILGSNFKDDMTVSELVELLAKDESMVSASEYHRLKNANDKLSKEAGDYRKQLNANKTAEELQKEAFAEVEKQRDEAIKKLAVMENEKKFVAMGYDEKLAGKTAQALADGDMKAFFEYQAMFNENQIKKANSEALKNTVVPAKVDTTNPNKKTKEDLSKMSIAELTQFAKENPEEYKTIYSE